MLVVAKDLQTQYEKARWKTSTKLPASGFKETRSISLKNSEMPALLASLSRATALSSEKKQ
jgi:hypothetical protein